MQDMIVRANDALGTTHMDREALGQWLEIPEITIRRHCKDAVVGHDPDTGCVLYDVDLAVVLLQSVKLRPQRRANFIARSP